MNSISSQVELCWEQVEQLHRWTSNGASSLL